MGDTKNLSGGMSSIRVSQYHTKLLFLEIFQESKIGFKKQKIVYKKNRYFDTFNPTEKNPQKSIANGRYHQYLVK